MYIHTHVYFSAVPEHTCISAGEGRLSNHRYCSSDSNNHYALLVANILALCFSFI